MSIKPIFNMVATVVNEYDNILEIVLYEYRRNKCFKLPYKKVVEILKSGVCIGNIKLTKRLKIETFPKECGFSRYCKIDEYGNIKSRGLGYVFISSHISHDGIQYTLFNSKTLKCEDVDENFILSNYDKYNLICNVIDIDNMEQTLLSSYYNYKVSSLDGALVKFDKYGNLIKFASYLNRIPECMWVSNINNQKYTDLIISKSTYGVGYRGINSIQCGTLVIEDGVKELEVEAIHNSKIGNIKLPSTITKLVTDCISNCEVERLELYGNTLIKDNFMFNCSISEIIIHGDIINFNSSIESLVKKCNNLQYIIVDKSLDNKSIDTLYDICDKDVAIITNEK